MQRSTIVRRLVAATILVPTLAAAAPSDGACGASSAEAGFWSSLGTSVRRALTRDPEGEALLTLEMPNGLPALLYGVRVEGQPSFTKLVLSAADGKKYRLDPYGVGAVSDALCEPFKSTHPYTYETADSKGLFEDIVSVGGANADGYLRATPVDSSIRVRAIHCMTEPY